MFFLFFKVAIANERGFKKKKKTYMELHLGVVVIVVHTEALVFGQDVQQLPLSLVHEDALVLPELLGASHQRDVDVINWGSKGGDVSSVIRPW